MRERADSVVAAPRRRSEPQQRAALEDLVGALNQLAADPRWAQEERQVLLTLAVDAGTLLATARPSLRHSPEGTSEGDDVRVALLSAVSHQLRTPLTTIKASISSLRSRDVKWGESQVNEFMVAIEEETDRLAKSIDAVLELSRLQTGTVEVVLRETSWGEVVPAAVATVGPSAVGVLVDLPDDGPALLADPVLLVRVIANLVDNAVRFSDGAAHVRLESTTAHSKSILSVIDRGPGIPESRKSEVFRPFQRLVDHGVGLGLGLAIARGLTEVMGGSLTVNDTTGVGTTMSLALPTS